MRKHLYCYLITFVAVTVQALASGLSTNEWGVGTNNVKMSIYLAGSNEEIKIGKPLKLIARFKNISTNEVFHLHQARELTEVADYSFFIDFPSGKRVSALSKAPIIGSDMGSNIGPNETFECELKVDKVCQLDEVGTYKIIVQREIWGPFEKRKEKGNVVEMPTFTIISNPLLLQIVK
jgi:hypothetical protein